jgi:hypothetical protein
MNRVGSHLHYSEGKAPGIKTTESCTHTHPSQYVNTKRSNGKQDLLNGNVYYKYLEVLELFVGFG